MTSKIDTRRGGFVASLLGSAGGGGLMIALVMIIARALDLENSTGWLRDTQGVLETLAVVLVAGGVVAGCWGVLRVGRYPQPFETAVVTLPLAAGLILLMAALGLDEPGPFGALGAIAAGALVSRFITLRWLKGTREV